MGQAAYATLASSIEINVISASSYTEIFYILVLMQSIKKKSYGLIKVW